MSQCNGTTSDGQRCHREISNRIGDDQNYCWQHQPRQRRQSGGKYDRRSNRCSQWGGADPDTIDLSIGRGQYWVMGKSRKTSAMNQVILHEPSTYRFQIPMMGETEMIHM